MNSPEHALISIFYYAAKLIISGAWLFCNIIYLGVLQWDPRSQFDLRNLLFDLRNLRPDLQGRLEYIWVCRAFKSDSCFLFDFALIVNILK